jgi:hypothetical protein
MFGMSQDLKSLKDKSVHQFKRIVIAKMKENSLNYLLSVKEKHSTCLVFGVWCPVCFLGCLPLNIFPGYIS